MDEDKKKLAKKLMSFSKDKDLAFFDEFLEIATQLKAIASKESPVRPETQAVEIKGAELVTIKGEKGDKGDHGEKGDTGEEGKKGDTGEKGADSTVPGPKGEDGKQGERGEDGDDGENGKDGTNGKDGSPDTGDQIIEKINESEEQIDKDRIKGLEDEIKRITTIHRGGGGVSAIGVRQAFKYIAHTEQPTGAIDGVNTTYTLKNDIWWIAGFTLNGEQVAQLPNFTYAGKTITFGTAIPAAYSGKDFEVKYIG